MRQNVCVLSRAGSVFILLTSLLLACVAMAAQPPDLSNLGMNQLMDRMQIAFDRRDQVTYVNALATVARKYPSRLGELNPQSIYAAARKIWKSPATSDAMYGLYEALFAANWRQDGVEPVFVQRAYIRLLIDRQEWSKAGEVVRRIRSPNLALELMADLRGDPLVQANPASFNIDSLMDLQIKELEAAARQYPRRLGAWSNLFYAYSHAGRYRQILAVSDELLATAKRAGSAEGVFEDAEDLNWLYDHRARAWRGLGDWAAAVREFKVAAGLSERGHVNVSNALNLANFYAEQGEEKSALEVLESMARQKAKISEYGRMTEMRARHIAALSSQNLAAATKALDYMRENRETSREMLLEALIREEKFNEAARVFSQWLADPDGRWEALAFVQEYKVDTHLLPSQQAYLRNLQAWLGREDVYAAIYNFGRKGKVSLLAPLFW